MLPKEHGLLMASEEGRRELMRLYGESRSAYMGENEHGEDVMLSIARDSIIIKTYQKNGSTRVNVYDRSGYHVEEYYER